MAIILILDDSATNRSIYSRLAALVAEGIAVEAFADPVDALEWLGHNRVDLVISDFRMPGMDGAAFTRQLRQITGCAELPVLIVTAHDDRSYRVRALDAGATDFLQSPIDHFEFVARARNLLVLGQRRTVPQTSLPATTRPPFVEGHDPARILDNVPAMLSATDREGRCVYANAAFAAHCGADPAELLGVPAFRLLGPNRTAWNLAADHTVFASGQVLSGRREEFIDDAGAPRVIITSKTPLRDTEGRISAVLTTSVELPPHALEVPVKERA
jgi:PAS domain S-box-containing protein